MLIRKLNNAALLVPSINLFKQKTKLLETKYNTWWLFLQYTNLHKSNSQKILLVTICQCA